VISISATNPTHIFHTIPQDIQEHIRALIAQHGNALAALAALWQLWQPFGSNQKLSGMWYIKRF